MVYYLKHIGWNWGYIFSPIIIPLEKNLEKTKKKNSQRFALFRIQKLGFMKHLRVLHWDTIIHSWLLYYYCCCSFQQITMNDWMSYTCILGRNDRTSFYNKNQARGSKTRTLPTATLIKEITISGGITEFHNVSL